MTTMRAKNLRYKFDLIFQQQTDEDREMMLRSIVGDIIVWIEEQEQQPAGYVPEPRLGPRPESMEVNHTVVDRIVDAAREAFDKGE